MCVLLPKKKMNIKTFFSLINDQWMKKYVELEMEIVA